MFKRLILVSSIALISLGLEAQNKRYTLKQCIDYAWQNNPDVRQSMLTHESSQLDVQQSRLALLPSFSANAGQNYQFGRTVDRFTNTYVQQTISSNNASINGSFTVFNGFQNQYNIKRQQALERSNSESIQNTKNTIALSVSSYFLQVIQADENIKNCEFQIESTKQRIERAQKQVDAGAADMSNLLSLKAQLANEELNLVNATNTKATAVLSLKTTMQMPVTEELEVDVPQINADLVSNQMTAYQIYLIALDNMPQVKAATLQSEAARYQTLMSLGNYSPNISLYGNINTVYSQSAKAITGVQVTGTQIIGVTETSNEKVITPTYTYSSKTIDFSKQLKDNLGQGLGLSLSWNIFNGFQVRNQIQKSQIQEKVSDLNLQRTKNTLLNDINLAVNNYNAARARHDAAVNNVNAQKLSYDYIQKRYDAGVTTSFDYIASKNGYLQAVSNELQARYELVFRGMILEYYKGNPITL